MTYEVICGRCLSVLLRATSPLDEADVAEVAAHCQRAHGIDLSHVPIRELVALVHVAVDVEV